MIVVWLFLILPWVGQRCVFVLFPDHTHLFFLCLWENLFFLNISKYLNMTFCLFFKKIIKAVPCITFFVKEWGA